MNRFEESDSNDKTLLDAYDAIAPNNDILHEFLIQDDNSVFRHFEIEKLNELREQNKETIEEYSDRFKRVIEIHSRFAMFEYLLTERIKELEGDYETPEQ